MCVKIIKDQFEVAYDVTKPIEEQISGSDQVVVNYDPNDASIEKFLQEMERLCNSGACASFGVEFNYKDSLNGFKVRKQIKEFHKGMAINDLISRIVLMQAETDKKLSEITKACFGTRI
jgi:hypothetical protein